MDLFVVYRKPKDFPCGYVVRRCTVQDGKIVLRSIFAQARSLEGVRGLMHYKQPGLLPATQAIDEPDAIESWTH